MLKIVIYAILVCLLFSYKELRARDAAADTEAIKTPAEAVKKGEDSEKETASGKKADKRKSASEIVVKGQSNKMVFPIVTEDKDLPGDPQSILDLLKSQASLNFRGQSDLITKDDDYFMRGFGSNRFTTAVDGMVIRKTGGRQASDIVDYGFIPPWLVHTTEIIPGPHSALHPAKSVGGVVNFVTKKPEVRDTLKPDIGISASYRSYNTQNYNAHVSGGVDHITYDAGYQYYSTDGFLRNTATDVQNIFGRMGYAFENEGYLFVSVMDSKADRQLAVENYPGVEADGSNAIKEADYDPDYPIVDVDNTGNIRNKFYSWQDPTWDRTSRAYRFGAGYPTTLGTFSAGGYLHEEVKTKAYDQFKSGAIVLNETETFYRSQGGRVEDVITISENHKITAAYDMEQLFDGSINSDGVKVDKTKRVEIHGGALQHEWIIAEPLTLTLGLRYEHVWINISNDSTYPIAGEGEWIEKTWDGIMPKSSLQYDMDQIGEAFRDTSIIAAVSRIWHAPDSHGQYNPQGKPAGYWLVPETGMGYDLIVSRRLFSDFYMKAGYSFSQINNYFAYNSSHADFTPTSGNPMTGNESNRWKDYMLNLEEMHRHGIEVDLNGKVHKKLKLNLSYAFQKYFNQGDEAAGDEEAGNRPDHRMNAGLRYTFINNLVFMADYLYQSEQVEIIYNDDDDTITRNKMNACQLVNTGLAYTFIDKKWGMENAIVKIFVNNVFNENYENARGYRMTDRTFGCALSAKI
jgi:iron complex outermembrane receptor protein